MRSHGVGHVETEADAHHLEVLDVCRCRVKIRDLDVPRIYNLIVMAIRALDPGGR